MSEPKRKKNPAAVALGRKGGNVDYPGKAENVKKANAIRWANYRARKAATA